MERPEITKELSRLVENHISPKNDPRIYWAREVTFGHATDHKIRVDYMLFKPINNSVSGIEHGDFYVYEVKSSLEDFHSPNGHNMIGDYNYYVMPEYVYEKVQREIPYQVGVYVPASYKWDNSGNWSYLKSVKKSKRKDRERPVSEMLLMMFRSFKRDVDNDAEKGRED